MSQDTLIDFVAGSIGGFCGKLLDYPFDTVKVLLQTQNVMTTAKPTTSAASKPTQPMYTGAWHCLRHTVQEKGFWSLYRGISSPLLGSVLENAVLFVAYGEIQRQIKGEQHKERELTLLELSLAGGLAGGLTPFVLTPFELVKCRLQVQASAASGFVQYKGPIDCAIQTVKQEGIVRGLYKGNVSMILREIPGNFCWYGVYEGVCMYMTPEGGSKKDLGPSTHLLGGAAAGVSYWTAFYPADTIKSHIQTNPKHVNSSFFQALVSVYRTEGLAGLYRGWGITAARAAPAHALIFAAYEQTLALLRGNDGGTGGSGYEMNEAIRD